MSQQNATRGKKYLIMYPYSPGAVIIDMDIKTDQYISSNVNPP